MRNRYKHIIDKERPVDLKHKPMSLHNRAAQFAPFDALTGFSGLIQEEQRQTNSRVTVDVDVELAINERLLRISEMIEKSRGNGLEQFPKIRVTYFEPDRTKEGGSYITIEEKVKKVDGFEECVIMTNGTYVKFEDMISLELLK